MLYQFGNYMGNYREPDSLRSVSRKWNGQVVLPASMAGNEPHPELSTGHEKLSTGDGESVHNHETGLQPTNTVFGKSGEGVRGGLDGVTNPGLRRNLTLKAALWYGKRAVL